MSYRNYFAHITQQRTRLGDPDYIQSTYRVEESLLDKDHIDWLRKKIKDDRTFPIDYYNPSYTEILDDHGTAHMSAVDTSGLAISVTTTVNTIFGSKIMTPDTGIVMNNEM